MKRRQQASRPTAPAAESAQGARPRRRAWWLTGLAALVLVLGSGAFLAWRERQSVRQVQTALPARPDLTRQPAVLGELLAQAAAKTESADTLFEGVGELGRLYHANGFNREAEACWRILLAAQPREARWRHYLADLRRAASDYPGMTALLEETLALAPDYAPARLQLANLQFKTGDLDRAGSNYRLRLAQLPRDPHARLGLVRLALQKGESTEARALLEQLLQDSPHFSTAHNLYSEILAAAGDETGAARHRWLGRETLRYREAEDHWLDELQDWCHDYGRLCVLGTGEIQVENHDRARVLLERAIRLRPGDPQAYELLGTLHLKRNEAAKARDLLEPAMPRLTQPGSASAFHVTLGLAYRRLQQPAEAVRVARLGLERAGRTAELLDALGLALADSGRHEEALAAWQEALPQNPGDAGMNYNLAVSLLALGRLDDALAALDRSLSLQPTFPPTLLLRGQIEMEAGHWEEAGQYLRPLFAAHPEKPEARRLLADWHRQMGAAAESQNNPAGAERHYRDGLSIDDTHAELQVSLGVFYLVQARFPEAIGPLLAYHRSQPENPQGCLFLGQAYAASGQHDQAREILTTGAQLAERSGNTRLAGHCRKLLQEL